MLFKGLQPEGGRKEKRKKKQLILSLIFDKHEIVEDL